VALTLAALTRSMHHSRPPIPVRLVSGLESRFAELGDDGDCRALSGSRGVGLGLGLAGSGGLGLLSGVASGGGHARQALQQQSDEGCGWAAGRQVDRDSGFELDDAGGDLDQLET
jgi:hypothetical protein